MPARIKDSRNILSSIESLPNQCEQVNRELSVFHLPPDYSTVANVVVSGMGGSALGARIITNFSNYLRKPIFISTEYHLPHFVSADTLVIISSYSGNTEETIHALKEAEVLNAKIVIICTGGQLQSIAAEKNIPAYIINPLYNPSAQPRMGLGYAIFSLLKILMLIKAVDIPETLKDISDHLRTSASDRKKYQSLALHLSGKIPVLIAAEHLKGAAHAFKNQLNENAKTFADLFDLPELNHHLLEGLSFPDGAKNILSFVFFTSSLYSPQIYTRFPITQDVVSKNSFPYEVFPLSSSSRILQAVELVQAGCYVSYYLAQINGVDPGPIPWVDWYKDEIRQVV